MKEITIIRHAKSDWGEELIKDVDRHLNTRGLRDAYFMSEWYSKNNTKPDLILSSTATRAISTALIFSRALKLSSEQIALETKLYEASVSTLFAVMQKQNNDHHKILVFGHNPGLTEFCNELSTDIYFDNLPTCSIASYQFNIMNWKDLSEKKGSLNFYQFPKNFNN